MDFFYLRKIKISLICCWAVVTINTFQMCTGALVSSMTLNEKFAVSWRFGILKRTCLQSRSHGFFLVKWSHGLNFIFRTDYEINHNVRRSKS